ncbi:phospho-beta-glucosidase B [Salmonella enterica subsp. enterica]|uniref:Phospho-beta-glucosidase B n=1 Tax=Salmonella enterica I TaxID=59201 RepID=A0A379WUW7_SALET|nr:phospho-beta-glucosidase B [Salmonella enterica subsp. enterica]
MSWTSVSRFSHGYLGQETNGAGGLFKGLRTIPVIFDIIKDVEELCRMRGSLTLLIRRGW